MQELSENRVCFCLTNYSLSGSLHRYNLLPSLVEGGGKIEDFDGGSFTITHITPSVSLSLDSSLKEGAENVLIKHPDKLKFTELILLLLYGKISLYYNYKGNFVCVNFMQN